MVVYIMLGISIIIITLAFFLFLFYKLYFLRDPLIEVPEGNNIVSPASGKVIKIIELKSKQVNIDKWSFGRIKTMTTGLTKPHYMICIMMTPFDMHHQKAPLNGRITDIMHRKGKLRNAVMGAENLKAMIENERNEITIKTGIGKIKVIQIAGLIARRIYCSVRRYQNIKKSDDLGVIKMGSQVSLIIPKLDLEIKEGDKVDAGETIIAGL